VYWHIANDMLTACYLCMSTAAAQVLQRLAEKAAAEDEALQALLLLGQS
jgi:hypothetical protein